MRRIESCNPARLSTLRIEPREARSLRLRRNNPRTHSAKQIAQIAASIEEFGFTNPILIDASGEVVAGHGRLRAARKLGLETVPTIQLEHLSSDQLRAYVIADNRLAENADWDRDLLAIEFQELAEVDLDFDLDVTGFETGEIDVLIGGVEAEDEHDPADQALEYDDTGKLTSRVGDLWEIGPHRLLCGDALDGRSYRRLLDGKKAHLAFVDPPYNVPIDGHVSGLGRQRHPEFRMASGEMNSVEFAAFLKTALSHHAAASEDGALHYVCMDWRHSQELLQAGDDVYSGLKNLCVWVKTNAGMGSFYRSQHELVHVFKVGTAPHTNNVELGRHSRYRTNVWRYPGANAFGSDRDESLAAHPAVKPVRLVADAILDASKTSEHVLDGFSGAGTTLLAAERTGRVGYAIELDPRYVDVTIRRLAEHAGLDAVHTETGLTFEETSTARTASSPNAASNPAATDSEEA